MLSKHALSLFSMHEKSPLELFHLAIDIACCLDEDDADVSRGDALSMFKLTTVFAARSGELLNGSLVLSDYFIYFLSPADDSIIQSMNRHVSSSFIQSTLHSLRNEKLTLKHMKQVKNAANLHAANATSIVGNSMAIPSRSVGVNAAGSSAVQSTGLPMNVSAAQLGHMNLSHVRSAAFKPAVPVGGANVVLPSPGASSAVLNTAGAGALQLSGRWSLDREDSDSTNDYLEAMGLPLIARQAADKLDLMVIISQTPGDFVITRRTRIFMETKQLKFGQEVNVKNNLITVTGDTAQIKTVTQLSGFRGVLTDRRSLDPRGRMHVELNLTLTDKPPVIINRYFKKTSESTSLENLPAFDMSLETAGDVKRKR